MSLSAKGFGWHQKTTVQKNKTMAGDTELMSEQLVGMHKALGSVTEREGGRGKVGKEKCRIC